MAPVSSVNGGAVAPNLGTDPTVQETTTGTVQQQGDVAGTQHARKSHSGTPIHKHDEFSRTAGTTGTGESPAAPLPGAFGAGRPVGARVDLTAGPRFAVQPGESWPAALERRYHQPVTPDLIAMIARVNRADAAAAPPSTLIVPELGDLYLSQFPTAPGSKLIERAEFVTVSPGQTWVDLVKAKYPGISDEAAQGFAEIIARLNGRSSLEPPLTLVAMPDQADLHRAATSLRQRRDRDVRVASLTPRNLELITRVGGSLEHPGTTPKPGSAYKPRWDDNLRGIVLATYRDAFLAEGLSPTEAERKAQDYMLALALLNDVRSYRVGAYGALWLPDPRTLDDFVASMRVSGTLDSVRGSNAPYVTAILAGGENIVRDARLTMPRPTRSSELSPAPPTSTTAPVDTLGAAESAAFDMRLSRAMDAAGSFSPPMLGMSWALFMEFSEDGAGFSLPNPGESNADYLGRIMPDLSPEERAAYALRVPELMQAIDALTDIGVFDRQTGTLKVEVRDGETLEQAARRTIAGVPGLSARAADQCVRAIVCLGTQTEGSNVVTIGGAAFLQEALASAAGTQPEVRLASPGVRETEDQKHRRQMKEDLERSLRNRELNVLREGESWLSGFNLDGRQLELPVEKYPDFKKLNEQKRAEVRAHMNELAQKLDAIHLGATEYKARIEAEMQLVMTRILRDEAAAESMGTPVVVDDRGVEKEPSVRKHRASDR